MVVLVVLALATRRELVAVGSMRLLNCKRGSRLQRLRWRLRRLGRR